MSEVNPAPTPVAAPEAKSAEQSANPNLPKDPSHPSTEGMSKEEAREAIRKYKVKVMGEEREVDEKELLRGYSHQQAANKQYQDAVKMKKEAEKLLARFGSIDGALEYFQEQGIDPYEQIERKLYDRIQEQMMDPRDIKLKEYEKKEAQRAAQEKEYQEQIMKERQERQSQQLAKEYEEQFVEALKEYKLTDKRSVGEMARYIYEAAQIGEKLTPAQAAKLVDEDIRNVAKRVSTDVDVEKLIDLYGEEFVNKVRKYDTDRLKNPNQMLKTPVEQPELGVRVKRQSGKRMTTREWRDFNRS